MAALGPSGPWVAADQREVLIDFFKGHSVVFDAVIAAAEKGPFGRYQGASTPEQRAEVFARRSALLERAVQHDDWTGYEEFVREQGAASARLGVDLSAWLDLVRDFVRRLTPVLVRAHANDPERLVALMAAQSQYFGRFVTTLSQGFKQEEERQREAEAQSRRTAEQGRLSAESRFARLSDAGIIGIIVARLDGAILEVNDTLLRILGRTREEVLAPGFTWATLTAPGWEEVDARAVEQLKRTGVGELREKEYLTKDGGRISVMVGSAMLDDLQVISFVLDLTERKWMASVAARSAAAARRDQAARAQAEAELQRTGELLRTAEALSAAQAALSEQRALFDRFFNLSADLLFIADPGGVANRINAAFSIFGFPLEELLARPFLEFVHPADRELTLAAIRKLRPGGPSESYVNRTQRKDGSYRVISWKLTPDPSGPVYGVGRDITEMKQAEEALRLAKDAAEAATRELESFSYSVAHDLRAPLRAINGFAQVLADEAREGLGAEALDALDRIQKNAVRMGGLIDALLALSRVTRSELRRGPTDLSALARGVFAQLQAEEPNRLVQFELSEGMVAQADPGLVRPLLENLLGNAWKFTSRKPCARIEFGVTEDGAEQIFFVRDDGAGFESSQAPRLFTAFQRLHTQAEFPGTGIGLATVMRIVRRHGGRLWAEGEPDRGATFYFTLPG